VVSVYIKVATSVRVPIVWATTRSLADRGAAVLLSRSCQGRVTKRWHVHLGKFNWQQTASTGR
jgi:hypothetical protein